MKRILLGLVIALSSFSLAWAQEAPPPAPGTSKEPYSTNMQITCGPRATFEEKVVKPLGLKPIFISDAGVFSRVLLGNSKGDFVLIGWIKLVPEEICIMAVLENGKVLSKALDIRKL